MPIPGSSITTPVGRFLAGALGVTGSAAAGVATAAALTNPASLAVLGVIAAFAGGVAVYKGRKAHKQSDRVGEVHSWLEQLIKQHGDLAKAMANLPADAPFNNAQVCQRIREVGGILAGDPNTIADRLTQHPAFAAFLRASMPAFEAELANHQADLDRLIQMAFDNKTLGEDAVAALNGLDVKVDHIIDVAERTERKIDAVVEQLMARIEHQAVEIGSLRTQLKSAIEGKVDEERAAGRSIDAMLERLRRGDPAELLDFLDRQVEDEEKDLIEHHRERAAVAYVVGDIERAINSLTKVLRLVPDDLDASNRLGHIHFLRGRLDEAEASYRRVVELAGPDKSWQAPGYGNLGHIARIRGNLAEAMDAFGNALRVSEELGDLKNTAAAYGNLGLVLQTRGDLDEAEAMHRKALEIFEKLGSLVGMAKQYGNLGLVMKARGDLDGPGGTEAMFRWSLEINQQLGRLEGMASDYGNLGTVMRTRSDLDGPEGAEAMFRKALKINQKLGSLEGMAINYANLGGVMEDRGKLSEARELWVKARDLFAKLGAMHMVEKIQGWIDGLAD